MISFKKHITAVLIIFFFFCLTLLFLFPLTKKGLILLPLDLLISNYRPWYSPAQILLKNPFMQDSIIQLYPWKHLVFQSFRQKIIPFWNPYQHLGAPFMANMKSMVFYPLNILFLLGEIKAWNILLFIQIFLAMVFSYLLSRDFKLKPLPSILVSLAFSLNSFMVGILEFGSEGHVFLWFPLLVLFSKRYLEKQKTKYLIFLGFSILTSILAGHLQYLAFMFAFLGGFIIFYGLKLKTHLLIYILLFLTIILGIGLSAFQLIPSIELFSQSYRATVLGSHQVFSEGLIKPVGLFRLLSPDFFGHPLSRDLAVGYIEESGYFGIIPLFFCLYAIVWARKKALIRFFSLVLIISVLFSLKNLGEILYILKIPVITSGSGGRIFILAYFSGAFLSGLGLTEFLKNKQLKKNLLSLISFAFLFALVIIATTIAKQKTADSVSAFLDHIRFSSLILTAFLFGTTIYLFLRKKTDLAHKLFPVFVIGLTFFDLFRLGYRFLTFSNIKFLYPEIKVVNFIQNLSRSSLGRTYGLTEPELATYLEIQTVETYNPLYLKKTAKLLEALQGKTEEGLPTNKYYLTSKEKDLKYSLDFLGVSYIVTNRDSNPSQEYFDTYSFQQDFTLIYQDDRYSVYENTNSYPRFGLYYQTKTVRNEDEALNLISQKKLDFKKELIINENLPFNLEEGAGSAKLINSTINTQKFAVKTNLPALFYISDTFFPGWNAKVNNQDTKIYQANYNFRAVLVPPGDSSVEFSYLPHGFRLGILISLSSLMALLIVTHCGKGLHEKCSN
jgi:hypothetical protein